MGRPHEDPRRRYLPYDRWPALDRELWEAGTYQNPGEFDSAYDDLDDDMWAATCSPYTLGKAKQGYARWLGFLDWSGNLDPLAHPADRPTRKLAAAYLRLMRELENSPYTMCGRFNELRDAFKVIAPDRNFKWLISPNGHSLRNHLRMKRKPKRIFDSRALMAWGIRLMNEALAMKQPQRRRVRFRDGLLIVILSARAPRLRAACAMCLGDHVVQEDGAWRIILGPEDMKTKRELTYGLPDEVVPYLRRYLDVEREELLQGQQHTWFWVNWGGDRLDYRGIDKRIRWLSEKEFGKAFGPHTFRYGIGFTGPSVNPMEPTLGAAILGISMKVFQDHYNRGGQVQAAQRHQAVLQGERVKTEGLARRAYDEHPTGHSYMTETKLGGGAL